VDDVAVGQDVAVRRDDNARAAARLLERDRSLGRARDGSVDGGDVDDGRADGLCDPDDRLRVGVEQRLGLGEVEAKSWASSLRCPDSP